MSTATFLVGIVVFVLTWAAAVIVRILTRKVLVRHNTRPDLVVLVTNVIYFGLFAVAVVAGVAVVVGQANVAFNGVLVFALITGLGLQDLAKNYVSGFFILFERNVRVGDRLDTQGLYSGTVTDVRLRATYLRGDHGELVVIPNSELFTKPIIVTAASNGAPKRPSGEGAKHDPVEGIEPVSL